MTAKGVALTTAVDNLERELAAAPASSPAWAGRIDRALAAVEQAVRRHAGDLTPAGEAPPDLDRPLIPSPGLERRTDGLRRELEELLREAVDLRAKVRALARPPAVRLVTEAAADAGALSARARQLASSLAQFEEAEIDVMQESVNTDIGAGD
jgi:hypothetical protein